MTDCFHCGDDDHLSYDCTNRTRRRRAPAAVWPSATAESGGRPEPPPFTTLYQRPPTEIADPQPWADSIREAMGWSRDGVDSYLRELAARQAAESRHDPLRLITSERA